MKHPAITKNDFHILFVDDEELTRKYFQKSFEGSYNVLTAGDADEGLAILAEQGDHIAILITDQRMPGKQGVELLAEARRNYPEIIRMLATAYTDLESAISAVNDGFIYYYIVKPWQLKDLRGILDKALEHFVLHREREMLLEEKKTTQALMGYADDIKALAISAVLLRHDSPAGSRAITRFISLAGEVLSAKSAQAADEAADRPEPTTALGRMDFLHRHIGECLREIDEIAHYLKTRGSDTLPGDAAGVTGLAQDFEVPEVFAQAFETFSGSWREAAGLQPDLEKTGEGCRLTISWEETGNEGPGLLFSLRKGAQESASSNFFKLLCAASFRGGDVRLARRQTNNIILSFAFPESRGGGSDPAPELEEISAEVERALERLGAARGC